MTFNTAFEQLLAAWRETEELRSSGAAFDELLEARSRLDVARHNMRQARSF